MQTRNHKRTKRKIGIVLWTVVVGFLSLKSTAVDSSAITASGNYNSQKSLGVPVPGNLEAEDTVLLVDQNCTPPAVDDFPPDGLTQAQRRQGYVLIHLLVSAYMFYMLAKVCDDYFVPCIECICDEFQVPSDVAGATFMAISTSSPELFTNLIGTFITKGDLGVGTVIGSAVFNVLGVCAIVGLGAPNAAPLEWYPLSRDCLFYFIAVCLLVYFMAKQQVFWYGALVLLLLYALYIFVMFKNSAIRSWAENWVAGPRPDFAVERTPLLCTNGDGTITVEEENEEKWKLLQVPPEAGFLVYLQWILSWPARFAFSMTIPNIQDENLRKFYTVALFMSVMWLGLLTYMVGWLITVIGYTLSVPDSVMGLTFIATGNSIPEAVSSIHVARQGLGTMSISNSLGSNTFDILLCLGLPWLIRGVLISSEPVNYIKINSGGLFYSVIMLLISVVTFYSVLLCNRFHLDRKVGAMSLIMYLSFLVLASLIELNIFTVVNLPTCNTNY